MVKYQVKKNPLQRKELFHTLDKVCNRLFIVLCCESDLMFRFFLLLHELVDGLKDKLKFLVILLFHGQNLPVLWCCEDR